MSREASGHTLTLKTLFVAHRKFGFSWYPAFYLAALPVTPAQAHGEPWPSGPTPDPSQGLAWVSPPTHQKLAGLPALQRGGHGCLLL